ncbi:hypothetical protein ACFFSH_32420 [Streptomyces filamentosus]|uniref:Uncharacterized protein n=1 Tax=Streptomyces filamentosus TaxID=67294 RepID=A0A919C0L7_STRFL|nr:hypothetical protein [Streptomyces filamentosus]GHG31051.1 hypothetical protein GCM10017667_80790 [Streptomyces filamentosus]
MTMTNARTTPRRTTLGRVLIGVGLLAPVVQALGSLVAESTRLVVLLAVFGAPWPYWLALAVLCAVGVRLAGGRGWVREGLVVVCAAAAVLLVFLRVVLGDFLSPGWEESERWAAPGGVERYVTVDTGAALIDPLWRVRVVSGSGLTARSHEVAAYGERSGFVAVAWDGPDALLVTGSDGTTRITLDPSTGAPDRTVDGG